VDELRSGESIIDRPTQTFGRKFLCEDDIDIRLISAAERLEEVSCGFM
jgi:hypothetical protein